VDAYDLTIQNRATPFSANFVFRCFFGDFTTGCPNQDIALFPSGEPIPSEGLGIRLDLLFPEDSFPRAVFTVQTGLANSGRLEQRGVDLRADANGAIGALSLESTLLANWVDDAGLYGRPSWRGQWFNRAAFRNFSLSWMMNYIGSQSAPFSPSERTIPSWITHDIQLGWHAPWDATLSLGVDNLADRSPIDAYSFFDEYNDRLYDDFGRLGYLRYTQRF
ncbi:MAG: TonB-dependent receptor, partial [Pseudomonadota bacterium]